MREWIEKYELHFEEQFPLFYCRDRKMEDEEIIEIIKRAIENDEEYRQSQKQRQRERNIRDAKRKEEAFRKAGLTEEAEKQHMKVLQRQETMRDFIQSTGRTRRYDREQIMRHQQKL